MAKSVKAVVRDEMRILADAIRDALPTISDKLDAWAGRLHNRPALTKAPPRCNPVTPEIVRKVRAHDQRYPGEASKLVGIRFNIDGGRVSEIRHGDYDNG